MTHEERPICEFSSKRLILRLERTIPGDVKAIDPVVEKVMEVAAEMGCAAGKEFAIETALREALANAVIHGCRKDPHKKIQICVACDEDRGMLIVVRDPGGGFDPSQVPNPVVGERVFAEHGRGIYLINQLMDEVTITRGGTEIRMRKD